MVGKKGGGASTSISFCTVATITVAISPTRLFAPTRPRTRRTMLHHMFLASPKKNIQFFLPILINADYYHRGFVWIGAGACTPMLCRNHVGRTSNWDVWELLVFMLLGCAGGLIGGTMTSASFWWWLVVAVGGGQWVVAVGGGWWVVVIGPLVQ